MFYVWSDMKGLLEIGQTVKSIRYSQQFKRLNEEIKKNGQDQSMGIEN